MSATFNCREPFDLAQDRHGPLLQFLKLFPIAFFAILRRCG